MRRIIYLFLGAVLATGCKDNINIGNDDIKSKLVVYCFPTVSDSTIINVSKSMPVQIKDNSRTLEYVDDAVITYTVNGKACEVTPLGNGRYTVKTLQTHGDHIAISVAAPEMTVVSAETNIPAAIDIGMTTANDVHLYNRQDDKYENFTQYSATFTDPVNERNFYATRVRMKVKNKHHEHHWRGGNHYTDDYYYPVINTQSEELLRPPTNIDELFDISNTFYGGLYIFDDSTISGKTYTLHLNVEEYNVIQWDKEHKGEVELMQLTPEFYHFLFALNAQDNEILSGTGLSQTTPTSSNVRGGLGIVAGYSNGR